MISGLEINNFQKLKSLVAVPINCGVFTLKKSILK